MKIWPVLFTYRDVQEDFPIRKSFESCMARSVKKGRLCQIRKGLYGLNDPSTGSLMANKFQIACRLSDFSFLDYHLAIEYYGLQEQSFVSEASVSSSTRFRPVDCAGVHFSVVLSSTCLGISERMKEEGIRVVTRERLVVDCLDHPSRAGGSEKVINVLALIQGLKEEDLLSILRFYDKDFLFLKAGYFLSRYCHDKLSSSFFSECLSHRHEKKYYLGQKGLQGVSIKRWNLIVPEEKKTPDALF